MTSSQRVVLAVDPGRAKCGVAVVARPDSQPSQVLHREVVDTSMLAQAVEALARQYRPETIVLGDGTSSKSAAELISSLGVGPVELADEKFTTLLARERYFKENPPKGLRRLIPVSLQTPPVPYDDYVAVILAERFLTS